MNRFGRKKVVKFNEFVEGTVVEARNGKLVARDYFKTENGELDVEPGDYELDFVSIKQKRLRTEKTREIADQLGYDDFCISEDAIPYL